jgi:hypothetical protein
MGTMKMIVCGATGMALGLLAPVQALAAARSGEAFALVHPIYDTSNYGLSGSVPIRPEDRVSCLTRKSTGRDECHTLADWRRVAAAIEAQQPGPKVN